MDESQEHRHRTWLDPLQRGLILDEYPDRFMLRTVRAQVGFGALLIGIQFAVDLLAWTLGLRWVFVDALGPFAGWPLTVAFALFISFAIAVFERFVLTADTAKKPLLRNPAVMVRLLFIVVAAMVTSVPMEMMIFHDVIQGDINADVAVLREDARQQLRADVENDIKRVDEAIAAAEAARLSPLDKTIADLQAKVLAVSDAMQQEQEGRRNGGPGQGARYASLKSQRDELAKLADAAVEKRQALATADRATGPQLAALLAQRERHAARLTAPLDDKELSRLTQRSLSVPDGFARRWAIMNRLETENELYAMTKWAVRLVILALGLLVFTTKLFFNDATVDYYGASKHERTHPLAVVRPLDKERPPKTEGTPSGV
jgi:hypothetical protein